MFLKVNVRVDYSIANIYNINEISKLFFFFAVFLLLGSDSRYFSVSLQHYI